MAGRSIGLDMNMDKIDIFVYAHIWIMISSPTVVSIIVVLWKLFLLLDVLELDVVRCDFRPKS